MKIKKYSSRKILITGGAGYIGSVLIESLSRKGFEIKVYDKFYFGKNTIGYPSDKIEIIKGDIRTPPDNLFDYVTDVIHLAGLSNDPTADFNPKANWEINTLATKKLAKRAMQKGVSRFIFASSCSIYDLGMENANEVKNETVEVHPQSHYSFSKYQAEKEILKLSDNNFCVVILRKGTVCGFSPRMRYDLVINTMVKKAFTEGMIRVYCRGLQWRPIIDVEDVAQAYFTVLKAPHKKVNGQIFNISLDNFLIKDIAYIVQKTLKKYFAMNVKIIFEQDNKKDRSYRVANDKAKKILHFIPKISIEESVVKLVKNIKRKGFTDFDNPHYYNIEWMRPFLEKEQKSA